MSGSGKKLKNVLVYISLSALIYAHVHFYYNTFYHPAQRYISAATAPPLDAVIVPGIPCDGGKWGFVMRWRVYWGVHLYKKGIAKNLIFSGAAVYTPYTEALIMAQYAEKMGVPKEHIFTEIKAEHTTENLYYSHNLAKEMGFKTIGFATDPFQSLKIEPYIQKFKLNVSLIPIVIPIIEQFRMNDFTIDSYKAYMLDFKSIRERETEEEQEFYSKGGRIPVQ